jgi:hypothetical protein
MKKLLIILLLSTIHTLFSQVEKKLPPPFNIKTISFIQSNTVPIFQLGSGFQLIWWSIRQWSGLLLQIIHCDYNWNHSEIPKAILAGFWQPTNSELQQLFQHLTNLLPLHIIYSKSVYAKLLISGNYILKILNDSKEVVFSRKFILHVGSRSNTSKAPDGE